MLQYHNTNLKLDTRNPGLTLIQPNVWPGTGESRLESCLQRECGILPIPKSILENGNSIHIHLSNVTIYKINPSLSFPEKLSQFSAVYTLHPNADSDLLYSNPYLTDPPQLASITQIPQHPTTTCQNLPSPLKVDQPLPNHTYLFELQYASSFFHAWLSHTI